MVMSLSMKEYVILTEEREVYSVNIGNIKRELPLFEVAPGVRIAIVNILGDNELVQVAASKLGEKLATHNPEVLVTAEAKSIPLIYALSVVMDLPYVVLRKNYKPYMGDALKAETLSITTGQPQTLYLDEKDRQLIAHRRVALIDDVISTGSTLQAMRLVMDKAQAQVVAEGAIFTEGDRAKWTGIDALGHLPIFVNHTQDDS
jgi:adenine phosphoribosyltransferase